MTATRFAPSPSVQPAAASRSTSVRSVSAPARSLRAATRRNLVLAPLAVLILASTACVPSSAVPDALPSGPEISRWPVRVQAHVDLWLHGFAMITTDTTPVPLFRRGYRDSITVVKNRQNAYTTLDANRAALAAEYAATPSYLNAQFLAFAFADWTALSGAITNFLKAEGDPQRATSQEAAAEIGFLAGQFRDAKERAWLRKFFDGLEDERRAFYDGYWTQTQRDRIAALTTVTNLWEQQYRAQFQRFLVNTQQRSGTILVSLPIGPEGRAGNGRDGALVIAIPMPGRTEDAREAIVVFAHEVVGATAGSVVNDNVTPAEQRSGAAARMVSVAQVRAGAILLENMAPELVSFYVKYYLAQGGHRVATTGTDASRLAALSDAYPVSKAIADGMRRQIEIALGGI